VRARRNAKGGESVADQKPPPEKRDEFQAFKSLTRKLVAVPKKEVDKTLVRFKARKQKPRQ
jgi:hypothetical protein